MATDTTETTIRIISFSGKQDDWRMWSRRFLAFADARGFYDALTTDICVPKDSELLDPIKDKDKYTARKQNKSAYSALMLACTDKASFGAIDEARTTDNPNGMAKLAWDNLLKRFEPTDQTSEIEILDKLHNCTCSEHQNPDDWFAELIYIQQQAKSIKMELSDNQLIAHVLNNLPSQYKEYKAILLKQAKDGDLKITDTRDLLRTAYKQMERENKVDKEDTGFVGQFKKQFKGRCNKCGRYGHKSNDCKSDQLNGFKGKCNYCGILGHKENDCRKKKREEENKNTRIANVANETKEGEDKDVCFTTTGILLHARIEDKNFWIADSGATNHVTNSDECLYDVQPCNDKIRIADGNYIQATKKGKLMVKADYTDGSSEIYVMKDVKVYPDAEFNLFSVTKNLRNGAKITSNGTTMLLQMRDKTIKFDRTVNTIDSCVCGVKFNRIQQDTAMPTIKFDSKMNISKFHSILGHPSEDTTKATAKYYNLQLTGTMDKCVPCTIAKAKQKNVHKVAQRHDDVFPVTRLYLDISSVRTESLGNNKFWLLIVDDATDMKWSFFLK
jgi:gag-polypeptide of LTR copia-type/Zinc knuckle